VRVLGEAEALGVVQVSLTAASPACATTSRDRCRRAPARALHNLATSAVPLPRARLERLKAAGLDNVQISIQDVAASASDEIAGLTSFARKLEVARWVKEIGFPLTVNVVLHRGNLARVGEVIALAESLDAIGSSSPTRSTWAGRHNRRALLPTRRQLDDARTVAAAARERLKGRWSCCSSRPTTTRSFQGLHGRLGKRFISSLPTVWRCPVTRRIRFRLCFENVRDRSLGDIWRNSDGFGRFRGEEWMEEPCRSCERRGVDYGGCRCQAFLLTGSATATDPVCSLSPRHALIEAARDEAQREDSPELVYRTMKAEA